MYIYTFELCFHHPKFKDHTVIVKCLHELIDEASCMVWASLQGGIEGNEWSFQGKIITSLEYDASKLK